MKYFDLDETPMKFHAINVCLILPFYFILAQLAAAINDFNKIKLASSSGPYSSMLTADMWFCFAVALFAIFTEIYLVNFKEVGLNFYFMTHITLVMRFTVGALIIFAYSKSLADSLSIITQALIVLVLSSLSCWYYWKRRRLFSCDDSKEHKTPEPQADKSTDPAVRPEPVNDVRPSFDEANEHSKFVSQVPKFTKGRAILLAVIVCALLAAVFIVEDMLKKSYSSGYSDGTSVGYKAAEKHADDKYKEKEADFEAKQADFEAKEADFKAKEAEYKAKADESYNTGYEDGFDAATSYFVDSSEGTLPNWRDLVPDYGG